ncbi:PKD domain-containing protein [Myxococcota bacterium]|nr:PKD domain-containing protein [Myxococcota bacterium]
MSRPIGLSLLLLGACAPIGGPTADAGFNVHGAPGQIFAFDGGGSVGESLRFQWTVLEAPDDAQFMLADADQGAAMLIPETEGTYVLGLEVCDRRGACDSAETQAWVGETASRAGLAGTRALGFAAGKPGLFGRNKPPEAVATASQSFRSAATVRLSASGSSDPDGDKLRYSWSIVSAPAESTAAVDDSTDVTTSFTADKSGTYQVKLTVRDGMASDAVQLPDLVLRALDDAEPIPWITSP